MIFRKKKNYEKIIYLIFLILYLILLLEMTLMGRRHTDPLSAVFTGWLPFKNHNATWNIDAL